MQSFVSVQFSSLHFISVMRGSVQCSSVANKDPFCSFSSTLVSVLVISFQFSSVRFGSVVINGQLRSFIFRFNAVHFVSLHFSLVQFSSVQCSSAPTLLLSERTVQSSWIQSEPTITPPWEQEITGFHQSDTLFEKKSVSDWSFSLDFKNFDHFHLGFVRSGLILSKSSVSYMNYYRYFSHFLDFDQNGHTFCAKKCVISSFSMVPESGTLRKWWILTIWTHFLWKKVCRFDFSDQSRRCSSESNANHQFYI